MIEIFESNSFTFLLLLKITQKQHGRVLKGTANHISNSNKRNEFAQWVMDLDVVCRICTCKQRLIKYSDSRTFKDLLNQILKLSRPYSVFKDFPGPGKITYFFSRNFKAAWPPCASQQHQIMNTANMWQK